MKPYILALGIAIILFGCDTKEKKQLQGRVDSLSFVLKESRKSEVVLDEVGVMLDSIDASRHALHTSMLEGVSYANYITRLESINTNIKNSQAKIASLEKSLKGAKYSSMVTIRRLKSDLDDRSKEIVALQMDVVNLREQNSKLAINIIHKDSLLSSRDEMIKMKNADVASLEGLVQDINDKNRIKVAGLYYSQAEALEEAAKRTKFAPRKKKETKREALELYKLAYSLGNTNALVRIEALEKDLS